MKPNETSNIKNRSKRDSRKTYLYGAKRLAKPDPSKAMAAFRRLFRDRKVSSRVQRSETSRMIRPITSLETSGRTWAKKARSEEKSTQSGKPLLKRGLENSSTA